MLGEMREITSFDGTRLAVQTAGVGPPVVLVNGLGGTFAAWRLQIEEFMGTRRFVSWDYRGIYRSAAPADRTRVTVDDHVRDLEAVLAAESIDAAVFMGWSMGVQVALEFYRRAPTRFRGLVLINGTFGHPFKTAFNWPLARFVLPRLLRLAETRVGAFQPLLQALVRQPRILGLLKSLRLAAPSLHEQLFRDLAAEYANMDFRLYIAILLALADHDAQDVLPTIAAPTLIITGQRDFFTPPGLAKRMADRIPGAELLEVKLGTHYTPVEFPDVVNLRLKKFFRDHAL